MIKSDFDFAITCVETRGMLLKPFDEIWNGLDFKWAKTNLHLHLLGFKPVLRKMVDARIASHAQFVKQEGGLVYRTLYGWNLMGSRVIRGQKSTKRDSKLGSLFSHRQVHYNGSERNLKRSAASKAQV